MSNEKWKCPKCGAENDLENIFCGECGSKKPEREIGIATAGKVIPKPANQNPNSSQDVKGESVNQKEVSRNKVKIVMIVCCLIAFIIGAGIYIFEEEKEAREQQAKEAKIAEEERMRDEEYENKIKPLVDEYLQETSPKAEKLNFYIEKLKLLQLSLKYEENKKKADEIISNIKSRKADVETKTAAEADKAAKKAEERLKQLEQKKTKPKPKNTKNRKGLQWSKKASYEMNWNDAVSYCRNLSEDGYSDWHLPSLDELRTLIQNCPGTETGGECGLSNNCLEERCGSNSCFGCSEDSSGKYNKFGDVERFWSSTVPPDWPEDPCDVNFYTASVLCKLKKHNEGSVRCVRK